VKDAIKAEKVQEINEKLRGGKSNGCCYKLYRFWFFAGKIVFAIDGKVPRIKQNPIWK